MTEADGNRLLYLWYICGCVCVWITSEKSSNIMLNRVMELSCAIYFFITIEYTLWKRVSPCHIWNNRFQKFLTWFLPLQNLLFQMQPKSKKHRGTSEIVTAQGSTKSHLTHSTPKDNTKAHIGQGQDTDSSDDDVLNHLEPSSDLPDSCFETIDLTSAVLQGWFS